MSFIFTYICKIFGHASLGQMTVATCRGTVEKPGGRKTAYLWGNVQACPACLLQNHNYGAKGATKLTNQLVHGVEKAYFFYLYKMFKARLVRSETPLFKNVSARYARHL